MARRFVLRGTAEVRAEIRRVAMYYPAGLATAIYKLGVAIMGDALPRTPVEFGVLRSSGYVGAPQGQGAHAQVEVGFGTQYAIPQHERMDYKHPRGGGPKYLERAIESVGPRALPMLAEWARSGQKWGQAAGVPTRPTVKNSTRKKAPQRARLARAASNVRKRTGR